VSPRGFSLVSGEESEAALSDAVGAWAAVAFLLLFFLDRSGNRRAKAKEASRKEAANQHYAHAITFTNVLLSGFIVRPCSKCYESSMEFLELSPNGRSFEYRCRFCGKKMRAAAQTEEKAGAAANSYRAMYEAYDKAKAASFSETEFADLTFRAPLAPLPGDQTRREPIPQDVRDEVWRRDVGKCVQCGSNQQLQYDHIIPVSKGGATTAQNLQLLCKTCNLQKGASI